MASSTGRSWGPDVDAIRVVIYDEAILKGKISIGVQTIVCSTASIIAEAGPIKIGELNIIEEKASIIYRTEIELEKENTEPLIIGDNNVFQEGCEVHAKSIGSYNNFGSECYVGPNVEVGNGCVIGAKCRITVPGKLPNFTVVVGGERVPRPALDMSPGSEDSTRQADEISVMKELYNEEEFSSYSTHDIVIKSHIPLPCDFTLSLPRESGKITVPMSYLPPIQLVASLPKDYPSSNCPEFILSCCWLRKRELERLYIELNRLWAENKCEILYIWCSFLKDESLDLLNIKKSYELQETEQCPVQIKQPDLTYDYRKAVNNQHSTLDQKSKGKQWVREESLRTWGVLKAKLTRKGNEQLKHFHKEGLEPHFSYLISYNSCKADEEFNKGMHECNVCFCYVMGKKCRLLNCQHITCVECLGRLCQVHIQHCTVESIVCPQENCGLELPPNLIKELVSKELYEKFDTLLLKKTLDTISNTYCPRKTCQYPISSESEGSLVICPSCNFASCNYCKRGYHGIEDCNLNMQETSELIESYRNADYKKKQVLEKKYGKIRLRELVNAVETEAWVSQKCKPCPCCEANIEKSSGCNKMICTKCNANFCWLCLTRIPSALPYLHFQDPKSPCYDKLFEGIVNQDNLDLAEGGDVELHEDNLDLAEGGGEEGNEEENLDLAEGGVEELDEEEWHLNYNYHEMFENEDEQPD